MGLSVEEQLQDCCPAQGRLCPCQILGQGEFICVALDFRVDKRKWQGRI